MLFSAEYHPGRRAATEYNSHYYCVLTVFWSANSISPLLLCVCFAFVYKLCGCYLKESFHTASDFLFFPHRNTWKSHTVQIQIHIVIVLVKSVEIVNPSRLAYKERCFHELWKYDMFQRGLPYRPAVMDSVSHTLLNKLKFLSYQAFHQTLAEKRYRPSHYVLQARMLAQSTYHVILM